MLAGKTKIETDEENRQQCISIAKELEAIADGEMYRCPHCGSLYNVNDIETEEEETEDERPHKCPHCDEEIEEPEQASMYDYFDDVYDIEYRIDGNGEYRSVKLCIAWGGPGIYVDTGDRKVKLYWWSDYAESPIFGDACDLIDEEFEDLYRCTK